MREVNNEELKVIHEKLLYLLCVFRDICDKEGIYYSICGGTLLGAIRHNGFIPWDTDVDVAIWLPDKERFRMAFSNNKPEGIALRNKDADPKCLQSHDTLYYEMKQIVDGIHLDIYPLVGAPSEPDEQAKFAKYSSIADRIIRSKYKVIRESKKKNRFAVAVVKFIDFFIPNYFLKKNVHSREYKYSFDDAEFVMVLANPGRQNDCLPKTLFGDMTEHEFEGEMFKIPVRYDELLTRLYGDYMTPRQY